MPSSASGWWWIGGLVGFITLMLTCFICSWLYARRFCRYRETPGSIAELTLVRNHKLGSVIDALAPNAVSVTSQLIKKVGLYGVIPSNASALVNWRPLTVRLAGYLGGINDQTDGVFDMANGVAMALKLGARAFVFDIDFLDVSPCKPVVMFRDANGYKRSLNTGSIATGCERLAANAFTTNSDPVLVILYMHRIPAGKTQMRSYLTGIAESLKSLATNHLGTTQQGNFHGCGQEQILFTSPITNFQKKFIVMTNYDTTTISQNVSTNPTDNLNFWTNARIWQDPAGVGATLGSVTTMVPQGQMASAQIASSQQLLAIPSGSQAAYVKTTASVFSIALGAPDYQYTNADLELLMNKLGIQCVPMDILTPGASDGHVAALTAGPGVGAKAVDLSTASNPADPLSYWIYAGWSRKPIIEGFVNPIPGFIIPAPVVPKKPPPSTNSNGGLVMIG